jgi:Family of unknown function (DUF5681)
MGSCQAGGSRVMGKGERRPGDPYEVGFGKPPKRTRFKKGRSGNPYGRPRKRPDLYSELTKVLREKVTVEGQPEKVTVQQALLLRLRDHALLGEAWAEKLLRKVVEAIPDRPSKYDHIEKQLIFFRVTAHFDLLMKESARKKAEVVEDPKKGDAVPDPVEPENDE